MHQQNRERSLLRFGKNSLDLAPDITNIQSGLIGQFICLPFKLDPSCELLCNWIIGHKHSCEEWRMCHFIANSVEGSDKRYFFCVL